MRPAILLLLLAAAVAAQPASLDGVVLNHATGQPLSGVDVRLFAGDIFGLGGADLAYGALSDKAGRFSVSGMKPGVYLVFLERAGFVPADTSGAVPVATVTLKAGQNLTGHKLEMNPRAMILGRVLDEYGDPVQRAEVEARPVPPDRPIGPPFFNRSIANTNERGEFQILTPPGRYYILASPRAPDSDGPPEIRTDGSSAAAYEATFYPSAAGTGSAGVVQATPGQDVGGIEIHLRRAAPPGPVFSVSGQVTGAPAGARATVILRSGDSFDALYDTMSGATTPDGKFTFGGLHAASCSVFALYSSGKTSLQSLPVDFQLDSSSRTDVQLSLRAGEELIGTLEIAGSTRYSASTEKRAVRLEPLSPYNYEGAEARLAETDKAGAFRLTDIHPSQFRVKVDPLPENGKDGAYIVKALLPGKYRVLVFDRMEMGYIAPGDQDEMWKAFRDAGQEIEVKEGERIVKDLKAIGKEDLHAQK